MITLYLYLFDLFNLFDFFNNFVFLDLFVFGINFAQLEINTYPTQNLFYHGIASINGETSCKVYSVNAPTFTKHLYLMPLHVASIKTSLSNKGIKGGSRRQTKRNKSKRAVRKSNKRIQRK